MKTAIGVAEGRAALLRTETRLRWVALFTWTLFLATLVATVYFRTPAATMTAAAALLLAAGLYRHFTQRLRRTRADLIGDAGDGDARRGAAPAPSPAARRWEAQMRLAFNGMIFCGVLASVFTLFCYAVMHVQAGPGGLLSFLPLMTNSIRVIVVLLAATSACGVYVVIAAGLYVRAFLADYRASLPQATPTDARLALLSAQF